MLFKFAALSQALIMLVARKIKAGVAFLLKFAPAVKPAMEYVSHEIHANWFFNPRRRQPTSAMIFPSFQHCLKPRRL